eukprot:scaffold15628_cov31-Prasinocladus_malaysianus.AAC.1
MAKHKNAVAQRRVEAEMLLVRLARTAYCTTGAHPYFRWGNERYTRRKPKTRTRTKNNSGLVSNLRIVPAKVHGTRVRTYRCQKSPRAHAV